MSEPVLAVHGGAGRLSRQQTRPPARADYERGLAAALRAGQAVLLDGGGAVEAVCAAVAALEDDALFNAGRGAVLCADGEIELSASVVDGRDRAAGAMAGLKRVRNPVRAARALMPHMHGLLAGPEANRYAERAGLEMVEAGYFLVPARKHQWEKLRGKEGVALDHSGAEDSGGTVGAVARDARGDLAAATSTGGLVNQLPGRVGDTPIAGAGTWADNRVCAVSATGKGDAFARIAFARRVADLIELAGLDAAAATERALEEVKGVDGEGGCILLTPGGEVHSPFNTQQMLRGHIAGSGAPVVAILPGEAVVAE
jgi:beta-aspartyl-peptidase (threonine type)